MTPDLPFAAGLHALGPAFYSQVAPTPLAEPRLAAWNGELAVALGLPATLDAAAGLTALLAGNASPGAPASIATVYSGHQFGAWAGQLGDGRALLLGELAGQEIQLKGAGETPYSRMGDGRAVLRSSIREYLCSEAMHGLGIPTTRALALVASPEPVWRETLETAAVVTRVAPSFLRFGHFEHFFYKGEHESLKQLADYALARYYPACLEAANPYQAMLEAVIARTAELIAGWQAVGFCHGVMNSDNMSLLGLTLDYGPFGFLDGFDAGHICNHSDPGGRYSYANQPEIGLWNLHCLAQALLPLLDRDAAVAALKRYQPQFEEALTARFGAKLGLTTQEDEDWRLLTRLFDLLQAGRTDWTIFWRKLGDFDSAPAAINAPVRDLLVDRAAFDGWAADYRARLAREGSVDAVRQAAMRAVNPKYVLRNHLAEAAIRAAKTGDFGEIDRLRTLLARPFDEQPEHEAYAGLPPDWAQDLSVSCSS
ncbi:protein adenylyltransferase SelO [Chitinimonas koreensis]|uniref:protein adenylyltransferase SelO n=1 Tax=Chitinimonas koreensis TaxID=356302 RepID=UPI00040B6C96|nr:YdiU family protein [Chitinimonas koreensis]QNM96046.1 YdiU family protein [Chitinimonas koreensis]